MDAVTLEQRRDSALWLAEQGFSIVRVPGAVDGVCTCPKGAACKSAGKHPEGDEWEKRATRVPRAIGQLLRLPTFNYGVFPAAGSGLIVVDVDVMESIDELGALPATYMVTTARGVHIYLRLPDDVDEETIPKTLTIGEIRRAGTGHVVGPWSVHASGATYTPNLAEIATATPEFLDALRRLDKKDTKDHDRDRGDAIADADLLVGESGATSRDDLITFLGRLRWAGATAAEMEGALVQAQADGRIVDGDESWPWTRKDFKQMARDIGSKPGPTAAPVFTITRVKSSEMLFAIPLSEVTREDAKPLRLGRLDPVDHTILFGDGGTGKGVIAAWWAARLTREGDVILILDYEQHARYEWRPRVESFKGDLSRVYIAQPSEAIWDITTKTRLLIEHLTKTLPTKGGEPVGTVWLFVDSVGYACLGQEVEKSVTATRYSSAIAQVGCPTLSLAHTTKADSDPNHPFGSVFWSNGARVTIGVVGRNEQPRKLENKKTNQRGPFATVELDWSWVAGDDLPDSLVESMASAPSGKTQALEITTNVKAKAARGYLMAIKLGLVTKTDLSRAWGLQERQTARVIASLIESGYVNKVPGAAGKSSFYEWVRDPEETPEEAAERENDDRPEGVS